METLSEWKIGFNTFWWEGLDRHDSLQGCVDSLVEIGYDAVEFKVDSFGPHPNKQAIVAGAKAAREAGLIVSNLVILRGLSQADAADKSVADIAEAIRICAEAEIGVLNFATGGAAQVPAYPEDQWWQVPTRTDPKAWDTLTGSLEALVEIAETEGVDLAIEPCVGNLVYDFGTALEMLARCDHPRLRLTFDPSHFVLAGQDLDLAIRRFGDRIRHVHMKDAVGSTGLSGKGWLFPILGEGVTDWPVFFNALRDIGYNGVLSIEFESFRFMDDVWQCDPVAPAKILKLAADGVIKQYGNIRI